MIGSQRTPGRIGNTAYPRILNVWRRYSVFFNVRLPSGLLPTMARSVILFVFADLAACPMFIIGRDRGRKSQGNAMLRKYSQRADRVWPTRLQRIPGPEQKDIPGNRLLSRGAP